MHAFTPAAHHCSFYSSKPALSLPPMNSQQTCTWNGSQSSRCSGTSAGVKAAVIWAHSNDYWSSLELLCSGESLLCLTRRSQGLMGRSRVSVSLEERVTEEYWSEVLCGLQWEWIQSLFSQGRSWETQLHAVFTDTYWLLICLQFVIDIPACPMRWH